MGAETGLRIVGLSLPDGEPLLGVWEAEAGAVAFAAGEEPLRWEVSWASPQEGERLLAAQEARLEEAERALRLAGRRLDRLARGGEAVAFAARDDPLAAADAELWSAVRGVSGEAVAFAALPSWEALSARWAAFLEQIEVLLRARLQVETREAGLEVARTVLGWDGALYTALRFPDDAALCGRHRRAVGLAMRSQTATVRLLTVIFGGAAALALQVAIPGAAWKLLPAVWKYVRQVQAALEALPSPASAEGASSFIHLRRSAWRTS